MLTPFQLHAVEQAERSDLLTVLHKLEDLSNPHVIVDFRYIEVSGQLASIKIPAEHRMTD